MGIGVQHERVYMYGHLRLRVPVSGCGLRKRADSAQRRGTRRAMCVPYVTITTSCEAGKAVVVIRCAVGSSPFVFWSDATVGKLESETFMNWPLPGCWHLICTLHGIGRRPEFDRISLCSIVQFLCNSCASLLCASCPTPTFLVALGVLVINISLGIETL